MNKLNAFLLAATMAGSVGLTAMTPAAYADERGPGMRKHQEQGQQMNARGMRGPGGGVRLICSADGAARLETVLGKVGENLTLTDAQKELLSNLKTTALTAQTTYADNCVQPGAAKDSDMIDRLKARQTNMAAQVSAMDEVIPTLEAFYTSLSDEQKADLRPNRRDQTGERGQRGQRSGGKHQDHDRKHRR